MSEELQRQCADAIQIPPQLPDLLKQYAKAAIRTQPNFLLKWSAGYFRALANGESPLAKERLEYPPCTSQIGVSIQVLKAMHRRLACLQIVNKDTMRSVWKNMCLNPAHLEELFQLAGFQDCVCWVHLLGLAAGTLGNNLAETMKIVCQVLTTEADGAEPWIPYAIWWSVYKFLADIQKVPMATIEDVEAYMVEQARANGEMVGPRHFMNKECPQLN